MKIAVLGGTGETGVEVGLGVGLQDGVDLDLLAVGGEARPAAGPHGDRWGIIGTARLYLSYLKSWSLELGKNGTVYFQGTRRLGVHLNNSILCSKPLFCR